MQRGGFSTTTQFVLAGGEEIADYRGTGVGTPSVLTVRGLGGLPVASITPATGGLAETVVYYHHDVLGSTVVSSMPGVPGAAEAYVYSDYGAPAGGSYLAYQYAGYRYDSETGLYYVQARYYSPTLGRFLQTDPAGLQGGNNLYAYVNDDPINLVDPMGLSPDELPGLQWGDPSTLGPEGASPQLGYTITGNLFPDENGGYNSSENIAWNVSPAMSGQIIQTITATSSAGVQLIQYAEAWTVSAQGNVSPSYSSLGGTDPVVAPNSNDTFNAWSAGTTIAASATFYPGLQLPTSGPGAFLPGNAGGVPQSGQLQSTYWIPNTPPLVPLPTTDSSAPVNRTWTAP